jgi:hypothetical protein
MLTVIAQLGFPIYAMEVMFAFESAPKSTPMKHVALEVEV